MIISWIATPAVLLFVSLHSNPFTWILMALVFVVATIEIVSPHTFPRLFLPRGSGWYYRDAGPDQQRKMLTAARGGAIFIILLDIALAVAFLTGWLH
jgi:hypothetical protein